MRVAFYDLSIAFYRLIVLLVAPFNAKAKLFIQGRKGLFAQLEQDFQNNTAKTAWFHCASLGEFEQGRPVIETYKAKFPDHKILVTFFSPSGYELRKNYEKADLVYYLPLDTRRNASRFLDIVKPSLVVFVKYEFWFHYLQEVHKRNTPLFCVSALFNPAQRFFKKSGTFFRNTLTFFDHIFVQNKESQELLRNINIHQTSISGDTRFDRVVETAAQPQAFPLVDQFSKGQLTMVVGSSWPADMSFLFPIIQAHPSIKFIIAPHDVGENSIKQLEKGLTVPFSKITEASPKNIEKSQVLIINTIGMLSSLYQYGDIAYIGGAFGDGLHNILEAATFGLPVIFGNHNLTKFPEAKALMKKGGAFGFTQQTEINQYFNRLVEDESFRLQASKTCKLFIEENTGATEKIMQTLINWEK